MVSLAQFYDMIDSHDWYHEMSDDSGVDARGAANWRKLEKIAEQSAEHKALLEAYTKHMYTGKPWKNEQAPKPIKPKE